VTIRAIAEPPTRQSVKTAGPGLNGGGDHAKHTVADIESKLKYQFGKSSDWTAKDAYLGTAWSVRERLIDAFDKTHEHWK
jgi:hypothetical protein